MDSTNDLFHDNPLRVVDIGASGGLHPRWRALTSCVTAVLFEPDPREQTELKRKNPTGTIVLDCALADTSGPIKFHQCRKQQVSSVYMPDIELLSRYPYPERFAVLRSIPMNADTLDNQLREACIDGIDFIKVDAQGYELPILQGGCGTLAGVLGIEVEVAFIPVYTGQALFCEIDGFARSLGYSLIDLRRTYWRRGNSIEYGTKKGQLVTADALYLRLPEQLITEQALTQKRILRAVGVYLAYGYPDLADSLLNLANRSSLLNTGKMDLALAVVETFKSHWMPDFVGRRLLKRLISRVANLFSDHDPYTGADGDLGNIQFPLR